MQLKKLVYKIFLRPRNSVSAIQKSWLTDRQLRIFLGAVGGRFKGWQPSSTQRINVPVFSGGESDILMGASTLRQISTVVPLLRSVKSFRYGGPLEPKHNPPPAFLPSAVTLYVYLFQWRLLFLSTFAFRKFCLTVSTVGQEAELMVSSVKQVV